MSACLSDRVASHKELCRVLQTIPSVESVEYLPPERIPVGRPETEILAERTATGTLPNSVTCKVCVSTLGIHSIEATDHPDYLRVVVR